MVFKLEGAQDDPQAGKPFKLEGAQDAPKTEPSFSQRVGEDFSKRASGDVGKKLAAGDISAPSAALQTLEQGGGFIGDVTGEVVKSGLSYVPEGVKQPVVQKAKQAAQYVANTDLGKAGIAKAEQAKQAWDEFAKKHPEAAADIGGLPNLLNLVPASALGSAVGGAVLSAGEKISPLVAKGGEGLVKSGTKTIAGREAKGFTDLFSPEKTKKVTKENVKHTRTGGFFTPDEVEPSSHLEKTVDIASKVPGVKLGASKQHNYNMVEQHRVQLAQKLDADLKAANSIVTPERVAKSFSEVESTLAKKRFFGDSKVAAKNAVAEARDLAQKNGYTAYGLLNARKQFDAWVSEQAPGLAKSEVSSARDDAWRAVRNSLNKTIAEAAPGVNVRESLERQHHLHTAAENLLPKAAAEPKTGLGRKLSKLGNIPGVHNPYAQGAAGTAGLGAVASPAIAGALHAALPYAAVPAVGYGLLKGGQYVSPYAKQGIGKGLTAMSDILAGPVKKEPQKLLTKAAPDVYTVDRQNVAKPITNAERQAAEASRDKATATGLTPDVRASQIRNEVNKAYEQRNLVRNAVKEEQIAKIAQQSVVPVAQLVEMSDKNIKELSDILGKEHFDTAFAQALRKAIRETK